MTGPVIELRCHLHLHGLLNGDVAVFGTGRPGGWVSLTIILKAIGSGRRTV